MEPWRAQQPGEDIPVAASGTTFRFLLQQGLLDEFTLLVLRPGWHRPAPVRRRHQTNHTGPGRTRPHRNVGIALRYTRVECGTYQYRH